MKKLKKKIYVINNQLTYIIIIMYFIAYINIHISLCKIKMLYENFVLKYLSRSFLNSSLKIFLPMLIYFNFIE